MFNQTSLICIATPTTSMQSRSRQGPGANGPAVTCATGTKLCIDKRPSNIFKYNKTMYSTPLI